MAYIGFVIAVGVVLALMWLIREIYRMCRKPKGERPEKMMKHPPKPYMSPAKGPRDWSPPE